MGQWIWTESDDGEVEPAADGGIVELRQGERNHEVAVASRGFVEVSRDGVDDVGSTSKDAGVGPAFLKKGIIRK